MKVIIKTKNLKLNNNLRDFIEEKINSLEKFSKATTLLQREPNVLTKSQTKKSVDATAKNFYKEKAKPDIKAEVEIGKVTLHHQKGPWFYAECQMYLPGRTLRATAERENLKLAICEVKDELQRQLKQYKQQLIAKNKRGARIFKKDLTLSPEARFWRKGRIREEGI